MFGVRPVSKAVDDLVAIPTLRRVRLSKFAAKEIQRINAVTANEYVACESPEWGSAAQVEEPDPRGAIHEASDFVRSWLSRLPAYDLPATRSRTRPASLLTRGCRRVLTRVRLGSASGHLPDLPVPTAGVQCERPIPDHPAELNPMTNLARSPGPRVCRQLPVTESGSSFGRPHLQVCGRSPRPRSGSWLTALSPA